MQTPQGNRAIGSVIREFRQRKGISQRALGSRVGLWHQRISEIEHGAPLDDFLLAKIVEELGVRTSTVLEVASLDCGDLRVFFVIHKGAETLGPVPDLRSERAR